ncbi:hypothetical protein MSAN_00131200 [Mycena sanguinolenta]|uniref:Uncharacterized protein n=1 Tax=Mycena sanguinolenta TaxID=230812 RepID=A0A8H6ZGS2_9AGAR|nr:hypothetical protein MSAN_00131200 [Mycena sanguinolenta]
MPIPTTLSNASSSSSARHMLPVAAITGGAIVLTFIIFAAIFFRMRRKQRAQDLTDTLAREQRTGKGAGGVGMLDGEGFDSVRGRHPPQIEYRGSQIEFHLNLSPDIERTAQEYNGRRPPMSRHNTQPPFLFPPRTSDSGSAFREEVWPPPRQESVFVDPLFHAPDDLARIVTDIMGQPPPSTNPVSASGSPSTSETVSCSASVALSGPVPAGRSRRNSYSTIYARSTVHSTASTSTLPPSSLAAESRGTDSDEDPPWPPTPGPLSDSTPPVSYWQKAGSTKEPRRAPQLRPSTGDGSPRVKNWLERTPRQLEKTPGIARRAASAEH